MGPRCLQDFSEAFSCIVLHAEFGRDNEKVRNGPLKAQSDPDFFQNLFYYIYIYLLLLFLFIFLEIIRKSPGPSWTIPDPSGHRHLLKSWFPGGALGNPYCSRGCLVGFLRFGKGTLATYGFGSFWGFSVGRSRECLWAGRETRPGDQNSEKRIGLELSGSFLPGGAESVCGRAENFCWGQK